MKREEFLSKLGLGFVAVCAGDCLSACGKGDVEDPSIPPPPSGVNFMIDLNNEIKNIGESKVDSKVIVARVATGNLASAFVAVQVACTHQQFSINYVHNKTRFICPLHNSEFSTAGVVLAGLAKANLKVYTCTINGTMLNVSG